MGGGPGRGGRVAPHPPSVPNPYTVTLTGAEEPGRSGRMATVITVKAGNPPGATLGVVPAPPFVNQQAVFTARVTPASGHSIQRYEWDFGDGTTASGSCGVGKRVCATERRCTG